MYGIQECACLGALWFSVRSDSKSHDSNHRSQQPTWMSLPIKHPKHTRQPSHTKQPEHHLEINSFSGNTVAGRGNLNKFSNGHYQKELLLCILLRQTNGFYYLQICVTVKSTCLQLSSNQAPGPQHVSLHKPQSGAFVILGWHRRWPLIASWNYCCNNGCFGCE